MSNITKYGDQLPDELNVLKPYIIYQDSVIIQFKLPAGSITYSSKELAKRFKKMESLRKAPENFVTITCWWK